jgi:hypothetical protein
MVYKVLYEVAGVKVTLGRYKTRERALKRISSERQKDNFGNNGYREYLTIKLTK